MSIHPIALTDENTEQIQSSCCSHESAKSLRKSANAYGPFPLIPLYLATCFGNTGFVQWLRRLSSTRPPKLASSYLTCPRFCQPKTGPVVQRIRTQNGLAVLSSGMKTWKFGNPTLYARSPCIPFTVACPDTRN